MNDYIKRFLAGDGDLYQLLLNVSNGIESVANNSMATRSLIKLDRCSQILAEEADKAPAMKKGVELVDCGNCGSQVVVPVDLNPSVAPVTERDGFYEKLWRDFLSLQSGDIQLMGKEAERYRFIRDSEGACIATNELHALDQIPLGDKLDAAIDAAMLAAAPTPPEATKEKP